MIRAVALLAEYHADAGNYETAHGTAQPPTIPPLLAEFWRFQRYRLPPNGGGLRDQPAGWFDRGETLSQVYSDWRAWMESDKGVDWRARDPDRWARVKRIREFVYG